MKNLNVKITCVLCVVMSFFALSFYGQDTDCEWGDDFLTPTVLFTDYDGSTIGSRIFNEQIPNPVAYMQQKCLEVAKILYRNSSNAPRFRELTFELKNEDFVAYKWGDGDAIGIAVSTQHLANVYRNSGNDAKTIKDEIDGILYHEVTHGYNLLPKAGGTYDGSSPFWAYVEGIADGVRIYAGFHQTRTPNINSRRWLGGYTTTGFFLQYVVQEYDKNFLYKFNKAAGDLGTSWSFDAAFRSIINKGVEEVWNEYADFIRGGNSLDYDGDYPWTLDCGDGTGGGGGGDDEDITEDGGELTAQYNDSPSGEGLDKLTDNNNRTKYLTFNTSAWVQYKAKKGYILESYTITSANDWEERDPASWTLQGSTDGVNWSELDNQTNQDFQARYQKKKYEISTDKAFSYFRLTMSNNNDFDDIIQVSEWELFGEENTLGGNSICEGIEPWRRGVSYRSGDLVTYRGNLFERTSRSWRFKGSCDDTKTQSTIVYPESESFNVYPNPATSAIQLQATINDGSYQIVDTLGKIVATGIIQNSISIDALKSGLYFITIKNSYESYTTKFVKE